MKILVVGDFHGNFPKKFLKVIKDEKVDLVVSNGDYFPFYYRNLWFKHCYQKDVELWEIFGKKKYKEMVLKDLKKGEEAISKINKCGVPVFTVYGNVDYKNGSDVTERDGSKWKWDNQDFFSKIMRRYKNIKRIDYSPIRFGDFIFVGMSGSSFPGDVKSRVFKKSKLKLEKIFRKYSKENREGKVIFVSHNMPYKTKLDKIGMKAHKAVRGKHYGSKLAKMIIKKFYPSVFIGGHIHEKRGKALFGRTLMVNPGEAHKGNGLIIELNGKIKTKFI